MKTYRKPDTRPLMDLFTRSPYVMKWVSAHKRDDAEFLVRAVEFDLDNKVSATRDRTFTGLWEAAIHSVAHTERTGIASTAYTRTGEGGKLEPVWKTFLRADGIAVCGAFGLTEQGTARAARTRQAMEEARKLGRDKPLPPPRPMTKAEKRRAVQDLLTPRLTTEEEARRAKTSTDAKAREAKAQLIADLLSPRLP
jgi:hypothetical protein